MSQTDLTARVSQCVPFFCTIDTRSTLPNLLGHSARPIRSPVISTTQRTPFVPAQTQNVFPFSRSSTEAVSAPPRVSRSALTLLPVFASMTKEASGRGWVTESLVSGVGITAQLPSVERARENMLVAPDARTAIRSTRRWRSLVAQLVDRDTESNYLLVSVPETVHVKAWTGSASPLCRNDRRPSGTFRRSTRGTRISTTTKEPSTYATARKPILSVRRM